MEMVHRPSLKHQFWKMVNRKKGYAELVLRKDPKRAIGLVLHKQLPIYNFDNDSVDYVWRWFAHMEFEGVIHAVGRKTTGYKKQSEAVKAITDAYKERCSTVLYVCNRRNEACLKSGEETCSNDLCYHTTDRRYAFVKKETEKYGI